MRDAEFTLSDGRVLSYADFGAASGAPVLYFHGAPTSRLDLAPSDDVFAEMGVRILAVDRPAYGGSTPKPGRVRADWTADALQFIDGMGLERCAVVGYSAGGPYALEVAATHPDRVTGVGVLAGSTDMGWSGAWTDYPSEHEPDLLTLDDAAAVEARCVEIFRVDGSGFTELMPELAPADAAVLADETMAVGMFTTMAEGLRQGIVGYAEDAYAEGKPWSFDPAAINAPVYLVHGERDSMVPVAHSRHTAAVVPTAELLAFPDHGHISVVLEAPALIDRLAALR
jgi:pimeloyl-ACP methyl ester carboxylesterase